MTPKIGRAGFLPSFMVMDVIAAANARAARGDLRVIPMMAGQPGTGAPRGAAEAASCAILSGAQLGYTETRGLENLRGRIAAHYQDWYGVAVDPAQIFITTGASAGFPLAFLASFDPGDAVALVSPYYPPYVNILRALNLRPVIMEATAATRFQPTLAMLQRLDPRPQGVLIASPCNPAGTMLEAAEFAAIAAWCDQYGVRLISDEIYHGLTYGTKVFTAASCQDAVVINSFSKYFAMTGWRIGWMVLPADMLRAVDSLAGNLFISAPHVSQVAAAAAFDCHDALQQNVARYRQARDFMLQNLPRAGFDKIASADGGFYIYADITGRSEESAAFCARMLEQIGVAICPGLDFDAVRGKNFVRFSYCGSPEDIEEAMTRLAKWR
jgi:aspartate/methionine/tyrosine aminotransferase